MKKLLPNLLLCVIISLALLSSPLSKNLSISQLNKSPNNPLLNPINNTWEGIHVHAPSVIYENETFKMWYAGHDGTKWQIGYASSPDGLQWSRYPGNPILSNNPNDPQELHVHTPRVIHDNGTYKMWYTASPDDASNWTIRYATSPDGNTWTRQGTALVPTQGWDSNGVVYPFVIKSNSDYKLWYTGFNGSYWKIGYATSPDGITWTPYANNPVIDLSSQGQNADGASVLYNGSQYEMFFHGVNGAISYTTSNNGIHWAPPTTALTPTGGTFDEDYMAGPGAVRLSNGTTLLYYGGLGTVDGLRAWRIGLATDGPIATPSPTPSSTPEPSPTVLPTPEPSPTSAPTPVPTAIPTPTPSVKKIVIIPGMGGSWSGDLLTCSLTSSGTWSSWPKLADLYAPIQNAFQQQGYTVLPFYYDWRKNISNHATELKNFITAHTQPDEKVDIVGHSMGGLVARTYVDQYGSDGKVDKLMTVGSPHRGTALAYPALAAGEIWTDDTRIKTAFRLLLGWCGKVLGSSNRETVQAVMPSFFDILPIDDYLKDQKTGAFKMPTFHNEWLPSSNFNFSGITTGALSGNNQQTLQSIVVKDRTQKDIRNGNWIDGSPSGKENSLSGDNTVLALSSMIPNAQNFQINQNHSGLISSPDGIATISSFLGFTTSTANVSSYTEPKSTLVVLSYPSWFWITDPQGKTINDTQGIITITNPTKGSYKLSLFPKTLGTTRIAIAQFLENGQMLWKEYKHSGVLPKFGTISIDPNNSVEDVLH